MDDCPIDSTIQKTDESITDYNIENVQTLKKQLAENEEKLTKFKKFVINLKNERTQLQNQINDKSTEVEKLKSELGKFQNKSYQQIFQNFQNLQTEYDRIQDQNEIYIKTNKNLENDLIKYGQELSNVREKCVNNQETINQMQMHNDQQKIQIEQLIATNKELEGKVIVLQSDLKLENKKNSDLLESVRELNSIRDDYKHKCKEYDDLTQTLQQSLDRSDNLEQELEKKNAQLDNYDEVQSEKQKLSLDNLKQNELVLKQIEQLNQSQTTIEELKAKNNDLEGKIEDLQLFNRQQNGQMERTVIELETKLKLSEEDLQLTRTQFDQYKQRVTNVMKENKLNNVGHGKYLEELNLKIEMLQDENNSLRDKCNSYSKEIEATLTEKKEIKTQLSLMEDQMKRFEDLDRQLQSTIEDKLRLENKIDLLKSSFIKEKQTIMEENLENIENLRIKFETKIKELEDEVLNCRQSSTSDNDSNSIVNSNTSFEEIKGSDPEILSYRSNNSSLERNFLEDILNLDSSSSKSPSDQNVAVIPDSSNIDNLTQLLSESENSITLLSEQNRLLKEEIRRLQRSFDRVDIANNLEYLKNVLLKFLTIKGLDERERLITVLTTILKLTNEERDIFHQCVTEGDGSSTLSTNKWSLWQWS
ncbi:hypothetical protein RDWZM_001042 [Blomia tropicalis]|uniref:GRIP domain-containing protein n=1 Tax=Blomia tropicalis TaxID=40697 RepID=A0A9Q0MDX3_BLOTA|nr:GRIP and coiled-coil domain-containing protein 2 [Blomia tropicalis]KAJ6222497.1 hypothetical protein RDWZM_001042 [Blomia tropicalis]